jgi:flavin reductase (DIM6/NTAB) family NADH-FMN oxidoreductase RutF
MTFDSRAFRDALGNFPTGVAVVTAANQRQAGAPVGITVNSFASVSLDPPLVLWCLDKRSQRHALFAETPGFTISVLGTGHREVSSRLARPGEHSLEGFALRPTELGPPGLADALAIFECTRESRLEGGDHTILVGRVLRFTRVEGGAPLVFFRGRYSALDPNR